MTTACPPTNPPPADRPELTYEPLDTVPATRTHQRNKPRSGTRTCRCGGVLSNAGIVQDDPHFAPQHGCYAVFCRLHCFHCGSLIVWTEQSNAEGQPQGVMLSDPGYLTDPKAVAQFVAKHPVARAPEDVA
ncbi:MAG: hypothetical protein AAF797_17795 [Planctomycetota bacterium]